MMAAHLFNDSGQMQEVDIPDIFDVLEGGEDESAVKFLLGFNADDGISPDSVVVTGGSASFLAGSVASSGALLQSASLSTTTTALPTSVTLTSRAVVGSASLSPSQTMERQESLTKEGKPRKREPVDPARCIYSCDSCGKAFTTKFNLKRHINLHCNKSKEAGVPIQGPPSASMPSRKARERREALAAAGMSATIVTAKSRTKSKSKSKRSNVSRQVGIVTSAPAAASVVTTTTAVADCLTTAATTLSQRVSSIGTSSTLTYPLGQSGETLTFQLSSSPTTMSSQSPQSQPHALSVAQPQAQPQVVRVKQPVLPVQPLPESTLQMIQSIGPASLIQHSAQSRQVQQTGQPAQPAQFYQQRIVRVVPQSSAQTQSAGAAGTATILGHLQSTTGAIPILQAIPLSLVTGGKVTGRTIQLPQQPLPVVQTLSASGNLRTAVVSSNGTSVSETNGQLPLMAANISSIMPKIAATAFTAHQRASVHSNGITATSVAPTEIVLRPGHFSLAGATISASIVSSSFMTSATSTTSTVASTTTAANHHLDNELSCPPDELFDSEDGDASSVATTTEAPTPTSLNGDRMGSGLDQIAAVKSLPSRASSCFLDDVDAHEVMDLGEAGSPSVENVMVVNSSSSLNASPVAMVVSAAPTATSQSSCDLGFTISGEDMVELPSNRFRGILQDIPKGWLRKVVTTGGSSGFQKVIYYNHMGKRFSSHDEVEQYFARLGYSVKQGLFNFEPPKLVDEDESEDYDEQQQHDDEGVVSTSSASTLAMLDNVSVGGKLNGALPDEQSAFAKSLQANSTTSSDSTKLQPLLI